MKFAALFTVAILAWMGMSPVWADDPAIPYSRSLKADVKEARARGVPLLVMFTSPYCTYCDQVLNEFLLPTLRNPEYASKVLMRKVEVGSERSLIDFNGKPTTHAAFAVFNSVMLSPTIIVFDHQGKEASKPIVGLGPVDYYGGFLDDAINEGLARVHAQRLN